MNKMMGLLGVAALVFFPAAGRGQVQKAPAAPAGPGARIEVEPELHDFGKVKQNLKLEKEFVIKNTGLQRH